MRKPLIAGNWKMHGTVSSVAALIEGLLKGVADYPSTVDVLVCPTFIHLAQVAKQLTDSSVLLGAQNLYIGEQGAFTGEVSAMMLKDISCQYVLIGHSERRTIFNENLTLIAEKCQAAVAANITPILCVGETQAQREAGETNEVIEAQLASVMRAVGEDFQKLVIAYEPVWAIGTGLTATPEQAQAVHADIRAFISKNQVDIAATMRILYGGSMKPDNAQALLAMPDIDGGLIGGAALKADQFLAICDAANR